jgi:glutamate---cysteine ligase / carboxylate-amine ligase
MARAFEFGIEEEHQILDPGSGELCSEVERLLPVAREQLGEGAQPELYQAQIEAVTGICDSLADARRELARVRRALVASAGRVGVGIGTAGTHPFSDWRSQLVTRKPRYQRLLADYQQIAREQVLFGLHVHVGIPDPEAVVQTMNRVRAWLPTILALGANSPFWVGVDTGYASYRAQVWRRWPSAGMPPALADRAAYEALVSGLVCAGIIRDATKVYWDVRPSERYPTLEFRIADACTGVDDVVMIAGLCRALARVCCEEAWRDQEPVLPSDPMISAAKWHAARFGLEGRLVQPSSGELAPVAEVAARLLDYLRPALEEEGDWEEVRELVGRALTDGNGATRQRRALANGGGFRAVVDSIATLSGGSAPW